MNQDTSQTIKIFLLVLLLSGIYAVIVFGVIILLSAVLESLRTLKIALISTLLASWYGAWMIFMRLHIKEVKNAMILYAFLSTIALLFLVYGHALKTRVPLTSNRDRELLK